MAQTLLPGGGGGYQLWAELGLAHQLPGRPAEGCAPHEPFDKLSFIVLI